MPRAGDAYLYGQIPVSHNPLERISHQPVLVPFDLEAFIAQWTQFFEQYAIPILEELTGLDLTILKNIIDGIKNILDGIPDSPGALLEYLASMPLNASNLFGILLPNLFSNMPIGALTAEQPNLLVSGNFKDLASIYDNPKWTWDSSVTRTADGTGSARTVANGTLRALRSKTPASVSAGQPLTVSAYAKTAAATGTVAIHLDVVRYSGTPTNPTELGVTRLTSWAPGTGSHDWHQLSATYTVPEGTSCIAVRFVVDSTVTGGTVWFDDAVCKQTGSLQLSWMPEAVSKFLSIFQVFGSGGQLGDLQSAWQNLLTLLNIGDRDDLQGVIDPTEIWSNIVAFFINPLGFFANLVGGKLPDSQKPQWLTDLTDGLGNLFTGSSNTNLAITNVIQSLTGIRGEGQAAQSSADNANIGVQILAARLDAVGVVGFDEFDYADANVLPSDKYSLLSEGPGGGHYGPNGRGQVVWKPSGFAARLKIYKRTDMPLDTNNGMVSAVWSTRIDDPLFSDGYGYLCGRIFDGDNNTRIQARIDNNTAVIQAVIGGGVTTLGPSADVVTANGDVWEFWYGTLTNPYKFWLKQNGTTVLTVEDTGHISQLGAEYRNCGFGGRADNRAVIFQIAPPVLNGWTWKDQNAA